MDVRYEFAKIENNILYYKVNGCKNSIYVVTYLAKAITMKQELLPIFQVLDSDESFYHIYCTLNKKHYSVFLNGHKQKLIVSNGKKKFLNQIMGNCRLLYNRMVARNNYCIDHTEDKFVSKYAEYLNRGYKEYQKDYVLQPGEYLTYGKYNKTTKSYEILVSYQEVEPFFNSYSSMFYNSTLQHFMTARLRAFKGLGKRPTFKSKHGTNSLQTACTRSVDPYGYVTFNYFDLYVVGNDLSKYGGSSRAEVAKDFRKLECNNWRKSRKQMILGLSLSKSRTPISSKNKEYVINTLQFNLSKNRKPVNLYLKDENFGAKTVTITREPNGKYYVSFPVWDCIEMPAENSNVVAFDFVVKTFLTYSDGSTEEMPKFFNIHKKHLDRVNTAFQNTTKNSKKHKKLQHKLTNVHAKIKNSRSNFQHQLTHKIVSENQVIISEDLDIKKMLMDKSLPAKFHRHVADASWYEFTRQLEYKSKRYGRTYIKVPRYYASSQICSNCGKVHTEMKDLSNRYMFCSCGNYMSRDQNAAINIEQFGLKMLA